MGFFALANPIANTPVFLGLTSNYDKSTVRDVAGRSVILAFLIVTIFAVSGKLIFELFGITLYALRIIGGILVVQIGFQMLHGRTSSVQSQATDIDKQAQRKTALGLAVTPLAMPILAGPGTIASAMNFSSTLGHGEVIITIVAFGLLCLLTYFMFVSGEQIKRVIGPRVLDVITKMMGLILAVIGMQMLIEGIELAVKTLS
jgi:multiple antibiotic resistance protein